MPYTQERSMDTAKLFKTGRSQAVRLPKEYRFEGSEVYIKRVGNAVVLLPKAKDWSALLASLEMFEPGFRIEREQPTQQQERPLLDTMFDEK
jgi:antitoxin VapB